MRSHLSTVLLIATAAAATPALAQDPQPQGEEIVVTGQKDDPQAIGDFVKALTPVASGEKLGRFEWAVLDWNQPSIDFYLSQGAVVMRDWEQCRVSGEALQRLSAP